MSELAQEGRGRRAPLEERRDGLVKGHCSFYFSANLSDLNKWIDDSDTVDDLAVLHVFGKQDAAA
jgi:hypothetical protein